MPPPKPGDRPRTRDLRAVRNAIVSIVVSGCQWRMLPKAYPNWQSVSSDDAAWRDAGTWQRIRATLRADVRRRADRQTHPSAGGLDRQRVTTTAVAGARGFDTGKHVKGRKRHLLVATMGVLLAVVVTAASTSDPAGARLLFRRLGGATKQLRTVWVDGT